MSLSFNHAMIYTDDLERALAFYQGLLGFGLIETYPGSYARLGSPQGGTTIGLHLVGPDQHMEPGGEGLRLYFEVEALDEFCRALAARGVVFDQMPKDMPWGWRHAYLRDPDGHMLSLYWAGEARFRATQMPG